MCHVDIFKGATAWWQEHDICGTSCHALFAGETCQWHTYPQWTLFVETGCPTCNWSFNARYYQRTSACWEHTGVKCSLIWMVVYRDQWKNASIKHALHSLQWIFWHVHMIAQVKWRTMTGMLVYMHLQKFGIQSLMELCLGLVTLSETIDQNKQGLLLEAFGCFWVMQDMPFLGAKTQFKCWLLLHYLLTNIKKHQIIHGLKIWDCCDTCTCFLLKWKLYAQWSTKIYKKKRNKQLTLLFLHWVTCNWIQIILPFHWCIITLN